MGKNIKVIEVNEREVREVVNTAYILHTYNEGDKQEVIDAWKKAIKEADVDFDVYCVKYSKKLWGIGGMMKDQKYRFIKLTNPKLFIVLDETSKGE
jgi:arabinogalactan endo-1,4-beta-galactosidase